MKGHALWVNQGQRIGVGMGVKCSVSPQGRPGDELCLQVVAGVLAERLWQRGGC